MGEVAKLFRPARWSALSLSHDQRGGPQAIAPHETSFPKIGSRGHYRRESGSFVRYSATEAGRTIARDRSIILPGGGASILRILTISGTTYSQTAPATTGSEYLVAVAGINGFAGTVALQYNPIGISPIPPVTSVDISPGTVAAGGFATVRVQTMGNCNPYPYVFRVNGGSGGLSHRAESYLNVGSLPATVQMRVSAAANAALGTKQVSVSGGSIGASAFLSVSDALDNTTYTISGTVTQVDGSLLRGTLLTLSGDQSASMVTDENGNYAFRVPRGLYQLRATSPYGRVISETTEIDIVFGGVVETRRLRPLLASPEEPPPDQLYRTPVFVPNTGNPTTAHFWIMPPDRRADDISDCWAVPPSEVTSVFQPLEANHFTITFTASAAATLGPRSIVCRYKDDDIVGVPYVEVYAATVIQQAGTAMGVGGHFGLTAHGEPVLSDGFYTWELITTQPGDDAGIATLSTAGPACSVAGSCTVTLQGVRPGRATLRTHYQSQAGGGAYADTRVTVVRIDNATVAVGTDVVGGNTTKTFPVDTTASALQWPATLWSGTTPAVLLRGSRSDAALSATTTPGVTEADVAPALRFWIEQDPDEAGARGASKPTLNPGNPGQATLALDRTGGWQVIAFVDSDGDGQRDEGETGKALPLVLVEATIEEGGNLSSVPVPDVVVTPNSSGPWQFSQVLSGSQSVPCVASNGTVSENSCAVVLKADVDLLGGGTDGRRGVEATWAGWAHRMEIASSGVQGIYQNGRTGTGRFFHNPPPPPTKVILSTTNPVLQPLNGALLDTNNPSAGTGADSSLLTTSWIDRMPPGSVPSQTLGARVRVTAVDAPGDGFYAEHQQYGGSFLTSVEYNLNFVGSLVLWTTAGGQPVAPRTTPGPTGGNGSFAERTYGLLFEQPWRIRSTFSIGASGTGTLTSPVGPGVNSITLSTPSCIPPSCTVSAVGNVILSPPLALPSHALDYRM